MFRARSEGRGIAAGNLLQTHWRLVAIGVTAVAAFCGAALLLNTMPPRAITMATGPESSGFQTIGKQYQTALERAGEQLRVVETAGSIENLTLLRDPKSGVHLLKHHRYLRPIMQPSDSTRKNGRAELLIVARTP